MEFVKQEVVYNQACSGVDNFIFKVTDEEASQLKEAVDVIARYRDAIKKIERAKISAKMLEDWKKYGVEDNEADITKYEYSVEGNIVTVKVTEASIG